METSLNANQADERYELMVIQSGRVYRCTLAGGNEAQPDSGHPTLWRRQLAALATRFGKRRRKTACGANVYRSPGNRWIRWERSLSLGIYLAL